VADQQRLLEVASAVAEGSAVNWEDAERQSPDGERSVVRALRLLAEIADVARNPSSRRTVEEPGAPPPPSSWGHLRVIRELGRGAFGTVFRAWDDTLEREVALKLMRGTGASGDLESSRALKEARRLARVRHPNVVTIHGADCHDGRFGIWMELIGGCTLSELLVAQGTMSAREAALVGIDLCHALAAVHRARLLHGDIKASNVMREDGGRVVLMDFGAGRRMPMSGEHAYLLAGTPLYLAPELLGGQSASIASDIYSLGVLLYQLVTGRYPVVGNDLAELALAHERGERLSLLDARPNLPRAFVDVVDRALAAHPKDRYQTAGQFGTALASVVGARYRRDSILLPYWKMVAAAAVGMALIAGVSRLGRLTGENRIEEIAGPSTMITGRLESPAAPAIPAAYQVSAAFYAVREGRPVRLTAGNRVAPGDQLFLSIDASRPVFVYVVNQDEMGESYLLFPLPGYEPGNPVPTGRTNHLPGSRDAEEHYWKVTSAGRREHFLVYVAPERLTEFEQLLAALPRAEIGRPVDSVPLSASTIEELRGVGGLTPAAQSPTAKTLALAELPLLPDVSEVARGVWARRITFDNPTR